MAYIGKEPIVGNFQKCDAITVVDGQAAYTLQVSSTNVVPESANHMLVSLNGILQAPTTSFTVSGATLTFVSNLATGDVIDFVILLGNVLDIGTPSDATVTNAKLAQDIISGETALAVAPADTDEFLVSDAGTLKRIDYSLIKAANTPNFAAIKTDGQQAITSATYTKATLNSVTFDTASGWDSTNNRWVVPTGQGGKYHVFAMLEAYGGSNDISKLVTQIRLNGTAVFQAQQETGAQRHINHAMCYILDLDATDYLELWGYITGTSPNIRGDSPNTFMAVSKVIE